MDLIVKTPHLAFWGGRELRCAIGRSGFIAADAKKEGDGATPIGRWALREVFYRADRLSAPETSLPMRALEQNDGWCDAPGDAKYNQFVKHPYPVSAEKLWREDNAYDIIVPFGYNDAPAVGNKGSAIFLHVAKPDYGPSGGCVVLAREDLLTILREATPDSALMVASPP